MTNRTWLLPVVVFFITAGSIKACDICGCGPGSSLYGVLPQYQRNFAGIRYTLRNYTSEGIPLLNGETHGTARQHFHSAELFGRWYPGKRWQLTAFIPWQTFYVKEEGKPGSLTTGPGDMVLLASRVIANTSDSLDKAFRHILQAGGGVKLPTGICRNGTGNPNLQTGSGSIDLLINAMYSMRVKRAGLTADVQYKMNSTGYNAYRFGNALNTGIRFSYIFRMGNAAFYASAGARHEQLDKDTDHGVSQLYTGGQANSALAGLDLYTRRMSAGISFQRPFTQRYGEGLIHNLSTFSFQLIFFIR